LKLFYTTYIFLWVKFLFSGKWESAYTRLFIYLFILSVEALRNLQFQNIYILVLIFLTFKNKVIPMALKELKTVKITSKGQISIPKDLRKIGGFKDGSKLALLAFDDHIEIRPLNQLKNGDLVRYGILTYKMSESSLAKDWLTEEEDRAWKHL